MRMNFAKHPKQLHKWILSEYEKGGEAYEQMVFCEWLEEKNIKFSSIPSSTWTSSMLQKMKNSALGLRSGLPDIFLVVSCGDGKTRAVFVEMKKKRKYSKKTGKEIQNGSKVSENQKSWIEKINKCEEVGGFVCFGSKEAKNMVQSLMGQKEF